MVEAPTSGALRRWLGPLSGRTAEVVAERLARYEEVLAPHPEWPPLALPRAILAAAGAAPDRQDTLLGGCALFFLAADIIDDAQDGDLPAGMAWPEAVGAGHALLFGALAAFAAAAPGRDVAAEVAAAGLALADGQARDLGSTWESADDVDAVMVAVRGKAGSTMALFARLAAHACGDSPDRCALWGQVGERLGMAAQLRSDLADLLDPESRDIRAGRLTLPIAYGLGREGASLRAARGAGDGLAALAALRRCGALTFVDFKIAALVLEGVELLEPLGLLEADKDRVAGILGACVREAASV